MSWDPYLELRTGVLRNRLGITDADELTQVEADISSFRIAQLWRHPLPGDYDLTQLRGFHRHLFGDLWDWAGELRTVRLGKGGAPFCQPEKLASTAAELFARKSVDELRATDRVGFLDKLAELLAGINFLHPFREGNGRTHRAFLAQLAREAGRTLEWSGMDSETHIAASRAARVGALAPLRAMLNQLLDQAGDEPGRPPLPRPPT